MLGDEAGLDRQAVRLAARIGQLLTSMVADSASISAKDRAS
jgi:hypothetical protein